MPSNVYSDPKYDCGNADVSHLVLNSGADSEFVIDARTSLSQHNYRSKPLYPADLCRNTASSTRFARPAKDWPRLLTSMISAQT